MTQAATVTGQETVSGEVRKEQIDTDNNDVTTTGTDTGVSSADLAYGVHTGASGDPPHDPAAGVLTGFPGDRTPSHLDTGAKTADDPTAGVLTGFPGERASHTDTGAQDTNDLNAGVLTGFPGERTPSHLDTGAKTADDPAAGILTGFPGERTPSHLDTSAKTADSTTDPSTPDRANEPGTGQNLTQTDRRT